MFKYFDVNCNKHLSKSEWLKGLKSLGITNFTNNILLELYDDYDVKRDGRLDLDEFSQIFNPNTNVSLSKSNDLTRRSTDSGTKALIQKIRGKFIGLGFTGILSLERAFKVL
jgi:Ca2+-binding EF-hand superfamily protein